MAARPRRTIAPTTRSDRSMTGEVPGVETRRGGWVGITANAHSGRGQGKTRVEQLVRALRRRGLGSRVAWTLGERAELVRVAGLDADCRGLVAAGGDGTVAALINERPRVPVTVLPAGTENLFAQQFGIGRDVEALADTIAAGQSVRIDLGSADGRLFSLMAGLGFDADVVSRHHEARVQGGRMRTTSRTAYVEPVLRASFTYGFPELTVEVEGPGGRETLRGTTAFVFNLPRYALGLPFAPMARADDGLLDVVVFRKPGPFQALHYLWLVFRRLHLKRDGVEHRRATRVAIRSSADVPIQLDGDPGGRLVGGAERPWIAEVVPQAVDVLVPAAVPARLDALARVGA